MSVGSECVETRPECIENVSSTERQLRDSGPDDAKIRAMLFLVFFLPMILSVAAAFFIFLEVNSTFWRFASPIVVLLSIVLYYGVPAVPDVVSVLMQLPFCFWFLIKGPLAG